MNNTQLCGWLIKETCLSKLRSVTTCFNRDMTGPNWQCRINWHDLNWNYLSLEECTQRGVCARCGHEKTRTQHVRSATWEYQREGSCIVVQKCVRCEDKESTLLNEILPQHQWNGWTANQDKSCEDIRVCARCDAIETRSTHRWGPYEYTMDGECIVARKCVKCETPDTVGALMRGFVSNATDGTVDPLRVHRWDPWRFESGEIVRLCTRCGHLEHKTSS
jgi:hypothetical protein